MTKKQFIPGVVVSAAALLAVSGCSGSSSTTPAATGQSTQTQASSAAPSTTSAAPSTSTATQATPGASFSSPFSPPPPGEGKAADNCGWSGTMPIIQGNPQRIGVGSAKSALAVTEITASGWGKTSFMPYEAIKWSTSNRMQSRKVSSTVADAALYGLVLGTDGFTNAEVSARALAKCYAWTAYNSNSFTVDSTSSAAVKAVSGPTQTGVSLSETVTADGATIKVNILTIPSGDPNVTYFMITDNASGDAGETAALSAFIKSATTEAIKSS